MRTTPRYAREHGIIAALFHGRAQTRTDLSRELSYHQTTTSRLVSHLIERGLVRTTSASTPAHGTGRPSEELTLNPDAGRVVGLELGRRQLCITVTDAVGDVLHSAFSERNEDPAASEETLGTIVPVAMDALQAVGGEPADLLSLGVALHDVVNANGDWIRWQHPLAEPFPIRARLERALDRPVVVEDISRAFAEAEHQQGASQGYPDAIYLYCGARSVGGGIFVNDRLLKSSTGVCGEIGHVTVEDAGRICQCGNRGCLETVASQHAIREAVARMIAQGIPSSLAGRSEVGIGEICDAASRGDKACFVVLKHLARHIAKGLAGAVSISGATRVLLGGGLRAAGADFLRDVREELRQLVIPGLMRHITVDYARLPRTAGALGVALQACRTAWLSGTVQERAEVAMS